MELRELRELVGDSRVVKLGFKATSKRGSLHDVCVLDSLIQTLTAREVLCYIELKPAAL